MQLEKGARLGFYEIISPLGAGGMGEVYRAKDTKLGREVAIKLLLEEVSTDSERLARFEREARVLASLNHNNVATLFGFEKEADTSFLVMELVEGETLADRIARGPIPVGDAVPLFIQIAEGLAAAHERGVIHRDLKPANIKVSDTGVVKVLDFGLAKALSDETAGGGPAMTQSPTLTLAATRRGEILGTVAYMSPEQASGKTADKRTDIWAFGVCFYEAITGRRAFSAEDAPNTLAAVLRDEVDLETLPAEVGPGLRRLVERCTVRNPRNRLQDIGDARIELQSLDAQDQPFEATAKQSRRRLSLWIAAGVATGVVLTLGALRMLGGADPSPRPGSGALPVVRSTIDLDQLHLEPALEDGVVSISPDGKLLIAAAGSGRSLLYIRRLDSLELRPLPGTEGGFSRTVFSPDGRSFVFWDFKGHLKKVPIEGGQATIVAPAPDYWGGAWEGDDSFIYVPSTRSGLVRVALSGGEPETVTRPDTARGEISHRWPDPLPDGRGVILSITFGQETEDQRIAVLSYETGEIHTLIEGASDGRYLSSGHLVFVRGRSLYAAPFDPVRLEVTGDARPVVEGVYVGFHGMAGYTVSRDGSLLYVPASSEAAYRTKLLSIDRSGAQEPLFDEARNFKTPAFSPDGTRLAYTVQVESDWSLWVHDLRRGVSSRLSTIGDNQAAVWTPDGERIIFQSTRDGTMSLYWKRADGSGPEEALTSDEFVKVPSSMSPDGILAYTRLDRAFDIWTLKPGSGEEGEPFLATLESEANGIFSPDGKWIAYELTQAGETEIFVQPYPADGRRIQLSVNGGLSPSWSRSEREIFYLEGSSKLMSLSYEVVDGELVPSPPNQLFEVPTRVSGFPDRLFDVSPDGTRFVLPEAADLSKLKAVLVQNWFEELKRLVPID